MGNRICACDDLQTQESQVRLGHNNSLKMCAEIVWWGKGGVAGAVMTSAPSGRLGGVGNYTGGQILCKQKCSSQRR